MSSTELSKGVGVGSVDHWIQSEPPHFFGVIFLLCVDEWLDLAGRTDVSGTPPGPSAQ